MCCLPVNQISKPEGQQGTGSQEAAKMPTPGVYWVLYSVEYRQQLDRVHADFHMNPIDWPTVPFIAEWTARVIDPSADDWDWFIVGDDRPYGIDDFTIIAGPLNPPIQKGA